MPEPDPNATLKLDEFPGVPTSAWEQQIRHDLKGADYDTSLVWRTDEGIAIRPYYRAEDAPRREPVVAGPLSWEIVAPGDEPVLSASAVDAHEAGATAVQEVAFALAQGADRLAAGLPVTTLGFAIGSNHFMEIAKLRAARLLWARVAAAFAGAGATAAGNGSDEPAPVRIHARTAGENKTLFDPYVNMLRVTTEALSAVLGGCDSLTITACGFDPHLADNVHHILREESHLDAVSDPGAGAYYIEALTGEVAAAAWSLFQHIEAAGGWTAFTASGAVDAAVGAAREAKEKAVASRRRVLVGTNNYPDVQERELDTSSRMPDGWRLASVFEAIRLRTERHAKASGRTPRVLLLERGDLQARKARAAFCLNFFGCAGFDIVQSDELTGADLVVLCSSDAEYAAFARDVCPRVSVPVVVAGNPVDELDALMAAGVTGFVHARSDAVETLTTWQARLGIEGQ